MSTDNRDYEGLRAQMLGLISAHSEERYAAGWMGGIEEDVRRDGGVWLMMAWACGGWPKGYRAENGWESLSDDELATLGQIVELALERSVKDRGHDV